MGKQPRTIAVIQHLRVNDVAVDITDEFEVHPRFRLRVAMVFEQVAVAVRPSGEGGIPEPHGGMEYPRPGRRLSLLRSPTIIDL